MSGATVLTVTPYRWVKPDGEDRLPRLIEAACSGNLDVLTFTSAPAVDAMWSTAHEMGVYKQLIESLKTTVTTAVVGPVTAQPLLDAGMHAADPGAVPDGCPDPAGVRAPRPEPCAPAGHRVRQHRAARPQPADRRAAGRAGPAPLLLLRALLGAGGAVLSRESLSELLELQGLGPRPGHDRQPAASSLPDGRLVETVVKRGYRIRV